jgi:hypothetical protein
MNFRNILVWSNSSSSVFMRCSVSFPVAFWTAAISASTMNRVTTELS